MRDTDSAAAEVHDGDGVITPSEARDDATVALAEAVVAGAALGLRLGLKGLLSLMATCSMRARFGSRSGCELISAVAAAGAVAVLVAGCCRRW